MAAERVGGTLGDGCDRREDEIVVLPQAERLTSLLYGLKPNTPERASASSTNVDGSDTGEVPGYNTSLYYNAELHTTMVVEVKDVRSRDQVHIRSKAPLVRLERAAGAGVGKAGQPLSGLETTNDGRVVTFAGALGASGGTVDQEVVAFKIRRVLRRASGR